MLNSMNVARFVEIHHNPKVKDCFEVVEECQFISNKKANLTSAIVVIANSKFRFSVEVRIDGTTHHATHHPT